MYYVCTIPGSALHAANAAARVIYAMQTIQLLTPSTPSSQYRQQRKQSKKEPGRGLQKYIRRTPSEKDTI